MNDTTVSATQSEVMSPDIEPAFVCDCEEGWMRSACQGEPFFREHEGKRYCVLHYPDTDKLDDFAPALKRKLDRKDFNFSGVCFPGEVNFFGCKLPVEANFWRATFSALANFCNTTFSADANFMGSTFSAKAIFSGSTFNADANFRGSTFSAKALFDRATFSAKAVFSDSTFSADAFFSFSKFSADAFFSFSTFNADVDFSGSAFSTNAYINRTTFKSYAIFVGSNEKKTFGEQTRINFQLAHIEKPERVSFHTLYLKPHWFINTDCRKFEFTDCKWNFKLKEELEDARKTEIEEIEAPHRLLAIAYRQLADNAEANHRYHEASNFRYSAFEARRIERFRGFVPWRLDWWYWLASGYGERVGRAFVVFAALFALFAFGYGRVGFEQGSKTTTQPAAVQTDTVGKPLDWKDAFIYSFSVSILQKPDPKPLTRWAKILVNLQTVLGPAQAALLALAVRRRFMR